jgi:hypothetical protein
MKYCLSLRRTKNGEQTGLNSKIGNIDYLKKKVIILKESNIISTKEVLNNNNDWSEIEITNRRNELVDYSFDNIWK